MSRFRIAVLKGYLRSLMFTSSGLTGMYRPVGSGGGGGFDEQAVSPIATIRKKNVFMGCPSERGALSFRKLDVIWVFEIF
ncbi:MAG: hypothetical protein ACRCWR_01550 [Saezia sp.]